MSDTGDFCTLRMFFILEFFVWDADVKWPNLESCGAHDISMTSRTSRCPGASVCCSYIKKHVSRSAFKNKRIAVWQVAFWARKVLGNFSHESAESFHLLNPLSLPTELVHVKANLHHSRQFSPKRDYLSFSLKSSSLCPLHQIGRTSKVQKITQS